MASTISQVTYVWRMDVLDTPSSLPSGVTSPIEFTELNLTLRRDAGNAPIPRLLVVYNQDIGAGYTINLDDGTAHGTTGNVDGTGYRVQAIAINNPAASAGSVTVAKGATNGYSLVKSGTEVPLKVPPGGHTQVYFASQLAQIGATKTLDVSGTSGDVVYIAIVLGD